MNYKLAIFDMDGTLINSKGFHTRVWCEYMEKEWHPMTAEEFDAFKGATIPDCFDQLGIPRLQQKEHFEKLSHYYTHEGYEYIDLMQMLPDVRELLETISDKKLPMVICSNSLNCVVKMFTEHLKIDGFFESMVGADFDSYTKNERCADIERSYGVQSDDILYIGDSDGDMKLAYDMHYDAVLADTFVRWCSDKDFAIREYKPKYIVKSFADFKNQIDSRKIEL